MADGVDIDLYADDLEQDFAEKDEFGGDGVDLYDDVISAPAAEPSVRNENSNASHGPPVDRNESNDTNGGYHHVGNNLTLNHLGRRHQLYVGNLTWWTTDQDIADAVHEVGVMDFQEVKFFENRSNGQSKGFCVISLGSENSMRMCMDRLSKKELHGQNPVVTLPTKQALNQFESQQKTRPIPPTVNGPRGPPNNMSGPPQHDNLPPPGHQPRMMNPQDGGPGQFRSPHMMQNMQGPGGPGPNQGPPRMQPPMHQGGPMVGPPQHGGPRFQNQGQWNNQMRPNGPPRPGAPGPNGPPRMHQQRPQMFQGPPNGPGGMPPRGVRVVWNRPPMQQGGFPQGPPGHPQGPGGHMQAPLRCPPPQQMQQGGPPHGPPQVPAPHVNPAFFNQGGGPPQHPGGGQPMQHGGPNQNMNMSQHGTPPFQQQGAPRPAWPGPPGKPSGALFPPEQQNVTPQLSEVEFEEIIARNRTVSSSAIERAVSDAAAGEYSSAIETLATAISLIKQSKVAHDERCKILISSLQDTLQGLASKRYVRRERSRSRDRSYRRPRRERSTSRYRERSRDRDSYRDSGRYERDRSRSRERDGGSEHYRDEGSSSSGRPRNKSPEAADDAAAETSKHLCHFRDRKREREHRDRERDREREHRERERDHRSRH